ncbi:bZIP transcription factor 44-like [Phragmites australis]|uniref:bZIP transcription factor 44-like n=1 Tax=Phragmites australis TaxID=29695 RepID=UPI002D781C53|nr:bZIP transcription factor 44-like [Phragmites australis]
MTMSSGTSFGSSHGIRSSRSEDDLDLQAQMERRRKRRKDSNRESARRSRLRKQQQLDDLTLQVKQLKDQHKQLSMAMSITSQNLGAVQAQNSVLQTQKMELESRLCALTEILLYMNSSTSAPTNPATMNSLTTTSGACDSLGASTWSQPIDLYYQCF